MKHNIYIYILVMAVVTYLIRLVPLTLIRKEIKNPFIRSFLYYVPYVTLAVMTFPRHSECNGEYMVSCRGICSRAYPRMAETKSDQCIVDLLHQCISGRTDNRNLRQSHS